MVCLSLSAGIPGLELPDMFVRGLLLSPNVQPSGLFSSLCESRSMFSSSKTKHLTFPAWTHLSFKLCPFFCGAPLIKQAHPLILPAHPIAAPPSPISAGASHCLTTKSYLGRCTPSPHPIKWTSSSTHPIATLPLQAFLPGHAIVCLASSCNDTVDLVVANHLSFLSQPSAQSNLPLMAIPSILPQAIINFLWLLDPEPHTLSQRRHHSCCCEPSSIFVAAFVANQPSSCSDYPIVVTSHQLLLSWALQSRGQSSYSPLPWTIIISRQCRQSSCCEPPSIFNVAFGTISSYLHDNLIASAAPASTKYSSSCPLMALSFAMPSHASHSSLMTIASWATSSPQLLSACPSSSQHHSAGGDFQSARGDNQSTLQNQIKSQLSSCQHISWSKLKTHYHNLCQH